MIIFKKNVANIMSQKSHSSTLSLSAKQQQHFFNHGHRLTSYQDYFDNLPDYFEDDFSPDRPEIEQRFTKRIKVNTTPLSTSPMDTMSESDMAIAMALCGRIGTMHHNRNQNHNCQASNEYRKVKKYKKHNFIHNPIVLSPINSSKSLRREKTTRAFANISMKDNTRLGCVKLLGSVASQDIDFTSSSDVDCSSSEVMSTELVTEPFNNHLYIGESREAFQYNKKIRQFPSPVNNNNNNNTNKVCATTKNAIDPVYLENDELLFNLILKERTEIERRNSMLPANLNKQASSLNDETRHSLLSWMLKICEHQMCQDEIFPLASIMLDKFLLINPPIKQQVEIAVGEDRIDIDGGKEENVLNKDELEQRQLHLFAACCLLLATKLRQTPRLCIQVLIEFSKHELTIPLSREEILDGELLVLVTLKWDLAALVTPNDYLGLLLEKIKALGVGQRMATRNCDDNDEDNNNTTTNNTLSESKNHERVEQNNKTNDEAGINELEIEIKCDHQELRQLKQEGSDRLDKFEGGIDNSKSLKNNDDNNNNNNGNRCDEFRVRRHTQTLLELCLMGKFERQNESDRATSESVSLVYSKCY